MVLAIFGQGDDRAFVLQDALGHIAVDVAVVDDKDAQSGQLGAGRLSSFMAEHGIATVINLRGANPGRPWYDAEAEAVRRAGFHDKRLAAASFDWPTDWDDVFDEAFFKGFDTLLPP